MFKNMQGSKRCNNFILLRYNYHLIYCGLRFVDTRLQWLSSWVHMLWLFSPKICCSRWVNICRYVDELVLRCIIIG